MPNLEGMETTDSSTRTTGVPATTGTTPATATLAVANCFLVVDDHEKALTFYRDVLELRFPYTGKYMFHAHKSEFASLGWMGFFEVVE